MKCLERNKQTFTYCTFKEKVAYVDANGFETGEYTVKYNTAVTTKAYITANKGETSIENFGTDLKYDRVIIIDNTSCPIDENTVLFIDKAYEEDATHNPLYNYIVKKVSKSPNVLSIAIEKVK